MIYTLGRKLGGRREVVESPMVEMLGYLIADFDEKQEEADREAQRLYLNHMSRMHAQPQSKDQDKANQKFIKAIEPSRNKNGQPSNHKMVGNKKLEWDSLDKLKAIENR